MLGPLVVACAITDDEDGLRKMGVRDSKKLTPAAREALEPKLQTTLVGVATVSYSAARLDALMRERTLNEIEVFMMGEAVITAARGVQLGGVDVLQLDAADTNEAAFASYVTAAMRASDPEFTVGEVISEHRADGRYPAVGAASIMAKVERDRQVRRLADEVGEEIGSGYPSDPVTIQFLRDYIRAHGDVPPFCRTSWQTTTDLLNEAGLVNRALEDFE